MNAEEQVQLLKTFQAMLHTRCDNCLAEFEYEKLAELSSILAKVRQWILDIQVEIKTAQL